MRLLSIVLAASLTLPIAASAQPTWHVGSPSLDVTGLRKSGELVFENPLSAMRVAPGNVLVVDRGSTSIRVLDPRGNLLKTVGRKGNGPGEFPWMATAFPCGGDSLLVWDPSRISIVGPTGEVARTVRLPGTEGPTIFCSPAGSIGFVTQPAYVPTTTPDVFTTWARVARASGDGKLLWQSDTVLEGERINARPGGYFRPLGPNLSVAFAGDVLAFGASDSARVWLVDAKLKSTVLRWDAERRRPTRAEFLAAARLEAKKAPLQFGARVRQAMERMPMPDALPAFYGLWGDPTGVLWVQTSAPGSATTDLLVLTQQGKKLARVSLSRDVVIYQIGRDFILGSYEDEGDEPHVVVYPLRRR